MEEYQLNYTNATEWFYDNNEGEEDEKHHVEDNARNEDDYRSGRERNNQELELDVYPLTLPFRVGQIIKKMAPVTTFCATIPNNNHTLVLNNLNRTKSLDNLNFAEKRQIIASTLSLADILSQGAL